MCTRLLLVKASCYSCPHTQEIKCAGSTTAHGGWRIQPSCILDMYAAVYQLQRVHTLNPRSRGGGLGFSVTCSRYQARGSTSSTISMPRQLLEPYADLTAASALSWWKSYSLFKLGVWPTAYQHTWLTIPLIASPHSKQLLDFQLLMRVMQSQPWILATTVSSQESNKHKPL